MANAVSNNQFEIDFDIEKLFDEQNQKLIQAPVALFLFPSRVTDWNGFCSFPARQHAVGQVAKTHYSISIILQNGNVGGAIKWAIQSKNLQNRKIQLCLFGHGDPIKGICFGPGADGFYGPSDVKKEDFQGTVGDIIICSCNTHPLAKKIAEVTGRSVQAPSVTISNFFLDRLGQMNYSDSYGDVTSNIFSPGSSRSFDYKSDVFLSDIQRQAQDGDSYAQYFLAIRAYMQGRYQESYDWIQKAAKQGHQRAKIMLAEFYQCGKNVAPINREEASNIFEKVFREIPAAAYFLGMNYLYGEGRPVDKKKGAEYLLFAANAGVTSAQCLFAECCYKGWGVSLSKDRAFKWWKIAADCSYDAAREELARCSLLGERTKQDLTQAIQCAVLESGTLESNLAKIVIQEIKSLADKNDINALLALIDFYCQKNIDLNRIKADLLIWMHDAMTINESAVLELINSKEDSICHRYLRWLCYLWDKSSQEVDFIDEEYIDMIRDFVEIVNNQKAQLALQKHDAKTLRSQNLNIVTLSQENSESMEIDSIPS